MLSASEVRQRIQAYHDPEAVRERDLHTLEARAEEEIEKAVHSKQYAAYVYGRDCPTAQSLFLERMAALGYKVRCCYNETGIFTHFLVDWREEK